MLQVDELPRAFREVSKEAKEEAAIDIARRLLQTKLSLEDIAKSTGLTLSQVKKLKKEMK
jgi:hypothetical protein